MARSGRGARAGVGARAPVWCLGLDLAGVERNETGVALLRDGRLERLAPAYADGELLAWVRGAGPAATVAINAPLTRPRGRCCLDDDCRCRTDPGTRSRQVERDLARMRVPTLATALLKVLARRGIRLAEALRREGWDPLEVYPQATLRLLGLPCTGKRTELGRRRIHAALQPLVPGLEHADASEHQLDAVICAYTAWLWRTGRARPIGDVDEGVMVIPLAGVAAVSTTAADAAREAAPIPTGRRRQRRVAEAAGTYTVGESGAGGRHGPGRHTDG
jgi:predicted nuclease with RNAse H fold